MTTTTMEKSLPKGRAVSQLSDWICVARLAAVLRAAAVPRSIRSNPAASAAPGSG